MRVLLLLDWFPIQVSRKKASSARWDRELMNTCLNKKALLRKGRHAVSSKIRTCVTVSTSFETVTQIAPRQMYKHKETHFFREIRKKIAQKDYRILVIKLLQNKRKNLKMADNILRETCTH